MGLITCPKCGKTVSEKAAFCPHCSTGISKNCMITCEDCGLEYDTALQACPDCGCPNATLKQKKQKKKYIGIVIFAIALVMIAVCVLGNAAMQTVKEHTYYENMKTVSFTMLDGAAKAETAGNLIKSVWNNAIYEKHSDETDKYTIKNSIFVDDFNDALSNLFTDEAFIASVSEIQSNQQQVIELMKKLKNPPKKYKEAYSVLENYYDNYSKMTKAVISPTGSLNSFSDDFNTYDTDTVASYEKMRMYLD